MLACFAREGILYSIACFSICFSLVFSVCSLTTCISGACMHEWGGMHGHLHAYRMVANTVGNGSGRKYRPDLAQHWLVLVLLLAGLD